MTDPKIPGVRLVGVDTVCLAFVMAVAVSPLADLWTSRDWIVAVVAGLGLAVVVTLLAQRLRLGPVLTVLLLAVGCLLVGPAAAAPHQAVAGVLPTLDAERTVVVGVVESWRSVLTLPVPLGSARGELVVPFVIALIGGALATTFLWRTRLAGLAALSVVACFVVAAAFGTHEASWPLARGVVLVVALLLWTRWRALRHVRTSWVRRVALGAAMVGVAGAAGWGLATAATGPEREVLRDHVEPPLAELDLRSPLARYRDYYKEHESDVLFSFDNLPGGGVDVRLATMDAFDGLVWNVATGDLATGTSAFRPAPESQGVDVAEVTVGEAYSDTWVPAVGRATAATLDNDGAPELSREVLINTATGAVGVAGLARPGDVYRLDWEPVGRRTNELLGGEADRTIPVPAMTMPESDTPLPAIEKLDQLAQLWVTDAGATDDYAQAVALEEGFSNNPHAYFNDGLDPKKFDYSPSGHGAKRLADLVQDENRMVGNDEQYASAMAYAAQRMGLPARVVLGFEEIGSSGTVTGDDIAAWVEIAFTGHGWVKFDPTPPEDRTPPPLDDEQNPEPQPYVVQPPVVPEAPEDVQGVPPEGGGKDLSDNLWEILVAVLGYIWLALKILLLLAPLWLILLAKRIRRRRRRRAIDPVVRLSAGWREVTDHARDLGARLPAGHTRSETSTALVDRFGEGVPTTLAASADLHVFGPGAPTDEDVAAYWDDVDTALKRMRKEAPLWRRMWAAVSPVSLPWRRWGRTVATRARGLLGQAGRVSRVDRLGAAIARRNQGRKITSKEA